MAKCPIVRRAGRWRRILAIGCTHGNRAHPALIAQVLKVCETFKPEIRVHLGDVIDTAPFQAGAAGGVDDGEDPSDDHAAGMDFLEAFRPTHVAWGNHDWRLVELAEHHPKGVIRHSASTLWSSLVDLAKRLKAKTVPYRQDLGWFQIGGHHWGHGYWFNEHAVRDHAEFVGGPVVMAHLHKPQATQGRTLRFSDSFCVGHLTNIDLMGYAHRRRATASWGHGLVYGEVSDEESRLWLARSAHGERLTFPPGVE